MRSRRVVAILFVALLGVLAAGFFVVRANWDSWWAAEEKPEASKEHGKRERVKLTEQGWANLQPDSRKVYPRSYERTLEVPGLVIDRPGVTDRGVPAPVAGIITQVHVEPGVAVSPGELLFTIRITSEYLQNAQVELLKTASEMERNRRNRKRLAEDGVVPQSKLIELDQQHERLEVSVRAYTQDLLSRGLTSKQIGSIERGTLIKEVAVLVPPALAGQKTLVPGSSLPLAYEVQDLKVDVGHKVEAGQLLAFLANHHSLAVEGRALAQETALIEKAARRHWPVHIDFIGDDPAAWPKDPPAQTFAIRYISNMIDTDRRTLVFQVPLVNQGEPLQKEGRTFLLWRYRPGQRVRLRVPVEQYTNVFVLPVSGIVKEGAEVYVFRQDGLSFLRKPVRLLYEDRKYAVLDPRQSELDDEPSLAHQGAAVLNRILKAQSSEDGGGHDHDH